MKMPNFKSILRVALATAREHTPLVLTVTAVGGVVATGIMAAKAAPQALEIIEEKEEEFIPRPVLDYPKWTWKVWVPTFATGALTITSIVMIHYTHQKRYAALMGLYALGTQAFQEFRDSVDETTDSKTRDKIREKVTEKALNRDPQELALQEVDIKDSTLCYDIFSGRYFRCDIETLRRAENETNKVLLDHGYVSLNELYMYMGLEGVGAGETFGWNSDKLVELNFESQLTKGGTPALTVDFYSNPPVFDYYKTK